MATVAIGPDLSRLAVIDRSGKGSPASDQYHPRVERGSVSQFSEPLFNEQLAMGAEEPSRANCASWSESEGRSMSRCRRTEAPSISRSTASPLASSTRISDRRGWATGRAPRASGRSRPQAATSTIADRYCLMVTSEHRPWDRYQQGGVVELSERRILAQSCCSDTVKSRNVREPQVAILPWLNRQVRPNRGP
jgi:hypothetical protein